MSGEPIERLSAACARFGFDLSAVTMAGLYNAVVDQPFRLPGGDDSAVLVIGNTAALWPKINEFVTAAGRHLEDPVDSYAEHAIGSAVRTTVANEEVIDVRFAHEPPPRRIAIQRLAQLAGLAWLSDSHLCVHPEFGPWIALRAAIVLDFPPAVMGSPSRPTCNCSNHCLPVFERAVEAGVPGDRAEMQDTWRLWLATRDACPVGRIHRYSEEQILYHYTGTRPERWL